ncbi:MAG: hypothetical protein M1830_003908, partial [Pleopsidium flavum]
MVLKNLTCSSLSSTEATAVRSGLHRYCGRVTAPPPLIRKVTLETSQLTSKDIIAGCKIGVAAHADFVKTSTGFNGGGATEDNVMLMRSVVGHGTGVKVKAIGGVTTLGDFVQMMEAGAERIDTSSGVWIMKEARRRVEGNTHEIDFYQLEDMGTWKRQEYPLDAGLVQAGAQLTSTPNH